MANPQGPGTVHIGPAGTIGPWEPPIHPLDPEQVREIQLLEEAVLVSFTATPAQLKPFGRAALAWNVTMPTTVIPGVTVEVHIEGLGGDLVGNPQGSLVVAPYGETTYGVALRTPLAARELGTLVLPVDFGACVSGIEIGPGIITSLIKGEVQKAFPGGGQLKLTGDGASVDFGINSFVIDVTLEAEVPNWFNADVKVTLGFDVSTQGNQVFVTNNLSQTKVSPGTASTILSGGCATAVADACETVSDGYLSAIVGPVIAGRIADGLTANVQQNLTQLNQSSPPPPVAFKLYDLSLTQNGLTYRFCPLHAPSVPPVHGPVNHPIA